MVGWMSNSWWWSWSIQLLMVIGCHLRVVHSSLFAQSIKKKGTKKDSFYQYILYNYSTNYDWLYERTDLDINILQLLDCLWLILLSDEYKIKNWTYTSFILLKKTCWGNMVYIELVWKQLDYIQTSWHCALFLVNLGRIFSSLTKLSWDSELLDFPCTDTSSFDIIARSASKCSSPVLAETETQKKGRSTNLLVYILSWIGHIPARTQQ